MNVEIKKNSEIFNAFLGWLPTFVVSIFAVFLLFFFVISYLFKEALDLDSNLFVFEMILVSVVFSLGISFIYLRWLINSILGYRLFIDDDNVSIKGMSGWKNINVAIPVNTISRICIGDPTATINQITEGGDSIKDSLATRLSVIMVNGDKVDLELACKVFKIEDLYKFLRLAKSYKIDTNVNV